MFDGQIFRHHPTADLPISDRLKREIELWDLQYQATLDHDNPPASRFATEEQERSHQARAVELAGRLQTELGPAYAVRVER